MHGETENSRPEQRGAFRRLINKATIANAGIFALSLANVITNPAPVSVSQTAMEGVDTAMPLAIEAAHYADKRGKTAKAIGWRSASNCVHVGAASVGIAFAGLYINDPPDTKWYNVAVSAGIGIYNLGVFRGIRKYRIAEETLGEANHSRNTENLGVLVGSNIVEAMPPLLGPLIQLGWENGTAASVIAANTAIIGMNSWQLIKDRAIYAQQRQEGS